MSDTPSMRVPDWKNAEPWNLEPWFSRWMLELTAQGLHDKGDIAVVLAMQSAALTAKDKELAEARAALKYWRDECSGNEPSLSVFNRMVDAALGEKP